jgi:hypothetical protein
VTKNDVWDARLDTQLDPPLPTLQRIKALAAGEWKQRDTILPDDAKWNGPDSYHAHAYPCPRMCARVRITVGKTADVAARLDLRRATANVRADEAEIDLRALANRNAFFITSSKPLDIAIEPIVSKDLPAAETGGDGEVSWIVQKIPGDADWSGMTFAVALAQDETRTRTAVMVATSREFGDPRPAAVRTAYLTCRARPSFLLADHDAKWEAFWTRSGIELDDPRLESVWYRSLYFLRCVSKPEVISPGLFAGLLSDTPAWHGDYHTNYNIQQTFWSAYAANHGELTEPYDRLITGYRQRARWLAKKVFDCGGAYYPHVLFAYEPADPDKCKSPGGRQYLHHVWGFTIGVSGFTVQPLWWRYRHDPDPAYLKETAYPAVAEVADFYADFIEKCATREDADTVILGPSVSPEHWGWTEKFERNRDCAFDLAMVRFTFAAAIEGATTLEADAERVARWQTAAGRLPDYPRHGEGDEAIVADVAGAPPITYNIPVPATPVFPGDRITFRSAPAERTLFTRTIRTLRHNGNNAPIMLATARLRLDMPDAYEQLVTDLADRARPNGTLAFNRLDSGNTFNDFGHYTEMFGAALPIGETLLQSVSDVIRVFPGLPAGRSAAFTRLRAQGGFLGTARRQDRITTELTIESTRGGRLRLVPPWPATEYQVDGNERYAKAPSDDTGLIVLETETGQTLRFRPAPE